MENDEQSVAIKFYRIRGPPATATTATSSTPPPARDTADTLRAYLRAHHPKVWLVVSDAKGERAVPRALSSVLRQRGLAADAGLAALVALLRKQPARPAKKKQGGGGGALGGAWRRKLLAHAKARWAAQVRATDPNLIAPISPAPHSSVDRVLGMIRPVPTAKDVLFDLGCGDGRWLLRAAARFGCTCVGYDLDGGRLALARDAIARVPASTGARVSVHKQDMLALPEGSLARATVVIVYLFTSALAELMPVLRRELAPGTPVVSLKFRFPRAAWRPERVENDSERGKVYFYRT